MHRFFKWAAALSTAVVLSGCGDTLGEQALLGAGAGAGVSVVTKGDVLTGALIGAAANAAYCQQYPSRC